jgi:hypothetical protein
MAGNTIDWNYDWYDASYYVHSTAKNPIGPERNPIRRKFEIEGGWSDNLQRSIRGGAWTDASGVLSVEEGGHSVRSDMRERTDQYSSDDHLGFRLVIDNIDRHPRYVPASKPVNLETGTRVGPKRLEYYFDYVSETERQLVMTWGGATIPLSIRTD